VTVVVAHPGRQHAYETAVAVQEGGLLRGFATGVYTGGGSHLARAIRLACRFPIAATALRAGGNRVHAEIDSSRIVHFPASYVVSRLTRPLPFGTRVERWADRTCGSAMAAWLEALEPSPGLVHAFEGGALEILSAAKRIGATTVLDVPSAHEYARREGTFRVPETLTARIRAEREAADWLFVPSEHVEACLVEHGVEPERIVRIPYGVDPEEFTPTPRSSDGTFRVLFVGFVSELKGLRDLLVAWREMQLERAELVIVGGADAAGRSLLREFEGLHRWVGQVPRHEVKHLYAKSDVFVLPSRAEGSALAVYEAMATGLPVITTRQSGSIVRDGVHGYIVPSRDAAALADKITRLHADALGRRAMGQRGRDLIQSQYTWRHYRARVRTAHLQIIGGRP
jgi:glycosyltransferase involved in cell wall biosynthesis